ncbi:LysE family transporter [Candidatus Kaiserbacteria bacterium]|nr:LysE family transporter [Candidatus Kaiserbacteria bacterium]
MLEIIFLGMLFGTSSAFTVGPIFIMIAHAATTRGFRASCNIIYGSAVADMFFLAVAYAFANGMLHIEPLLPALTIIGALYFLWVGCDMLWKTITQDPIVSSGDIKGASGMFVAGVMGNLANPSTWIFWAAVGGALLINAYKTAGHLGMIVFTLVWFGTAMLWEAGVAFGCARTRSMLDEKTLKKINFCAGALFIVVALLTLAR